MDSQNLQPAYFIGDSDIDFPIETAEPSEGGVKGVGSVGGCDDDHVSSCLETVHKGQQLRDNSPFDLTMHLFSVGSNRIDLVDEDNSGAVLLCLLEGLSQISLCLSCHLRHDFGSVDKEEEGSSLVGNSSGDQGLA